MPELPEVETIRRDLEPLILDQQLKKLVVQERVHLLKNCTPVELDKKIRGVVLSEIGRRGKFLFFHFDDNIVILHLRMSGRLLTTPASHTRMEFHFANKQSIYFDDARRFGMLYLASEDEIEELPSIKQLGMEPLSECYNLEQFKRSLSSKREIKQVLLDQRVIAGLGNIYACEALFKAGVHPAKRANELSSAESQALFDAIPEVLHKAIHAGGTSIRDYQTPSGELGNFQSEFCVYSREGKACLHCGSPIERMTHGGRSSFFCSACQPSSL